MSFPPATPLEPLRRVVTAHKPDGELTVAYDDHVPSKPLEGIVPGVYISRIWSTTVSSENNAAFVPTEHVGPGGITDMGAARQFTERFGIVSSGGTNCTLTEIAPGAKVPMHRTHSIDYNILVSGSLTHVLESGETQTISIPGSVIVQRGTMHGWENQGTEWVRYISVLVDAEPINVESGKALAEEFHFGVSAPGET